MLLMTSFASNVTAVNVAVKLYVVVRRIEIADMFPVVPDGAAVVKMLPDESNAK